VLTVVGIRTEGIGRLVIHHGPPAGAEGSNRTV
jgi:hypothetical protein